MGRSLIVASFLLATFASGSAIAADKETIIKEADGRETKVITEPKGTSVQTDGKEVWNSSGDRHREQVEQSERNGGIVKESNEKIN